MWQKGSERSARREKQEVKSVRSERGLVSLEQESTLLANKFGQKKKRPKIKQHSTKI